MTDMISIVQLLQDNTNLNFDEEKIKKIYNSGSDRVFLRLYSEQGSFVLMHSPTEAIGSYLKMQKILAESRIPVPKITYSNAKNGLVLMEDCGDASLYSYCQGHEPVDLYEKVIDILIDVQINTTKYIEDNAIEIPQFDYNVYKWETEYFREHYLQQFLGLGIDNERYEEETAKLAKYCSLLPRVFLHRDFQSQNILLQDNGRVIKIIDFQTAKMGSNYYDLASLLFDPYVKFSEDIYIRLLNYYSANCQYKGLSFDEQDFYLAASQRIMQALGAYCNLGLNKGRKWFLDYIPQAKANLKYIMKRIPEAGYIKKLLQDL